MEIKHKNLHLSFADGCNPALPLKVYRESPISGWDIPIRWAIDAENQCYGEFSAHGSTMEKVTLDQLLRKLCSVEDESGENLVRKTMGLKVKAPVWMRAAKASGWTPPQGFNETDYEWA